MLQIIELGSAQEYVRKVQADPKCREAVCIIPLSDLKSIVILHNLGLNCLQGAGYCRRGTARLALTDEAFWFYVSQADRWKTWRPVSSYSMPMLFGLIACGWGLLKGYFLGSSTGRLADHTYGGWYIEMC